LGLIVAVIVTFVGLRTIYVAFREKMRPMTPTAPPPTAEAAA
jgi:hypothetical protein